MGTVPRGMRASRRACCSTSTTAHITNTTRFALGYGWEVALCPGRCVLLICLASVRRVD